MRFKKARLGPQLLWRARDPAFFGQIHVLFGGTGAVGGATAVQMVSLFEEAARRSLLTERAEPRIVITGRTKQEVRQFTHLLFEIQKRDHGCFPQALAGVHAVRALLDGEGLEGRWFDRTLDYAARRRGEKFDRLKYSTPETLTLEPLPCWRHLEPEQRKKLIAALVKEIEEEARAARQRDGVQVAGAAAVLAHHPHDRPEKLKKGPAPLFHAATAEMRQFLWSLYAEFVARFRDAAEKLRHQAHTGPYS